MHQNPSTAICLGVGFSLRFYFIPNICQSLPPWKEGYLDIHHINTGNGDAAFLVFPDGMTLLFAAGDLDEEAFQKKNAPF